ncbi:MAG: glycosyltransferase family 4 protein [Candidatus Rokubacteria bacterium]|nr:glycosyltransferase family 4 protein [Candidatus Rokubacteria bacterium]
MRAGRPLRIVKITPMPFFVDAGGCVRVLEEARALERAGHRVVICTYNMGRDLPGLEIVRVPRAIPQYGPADLALTPRKLLVKLGLDIALLATALRVARAVRADCLHAHLDDGALLGLILSRLLRTPMIYDCQGSYTATLIGDGSLRPRSLAARLRVSAERIVARACPLVVTSAPHTAEHLIREVGIEPTRIRVLLDRINTDLFQPGLAPAGLRERLAIPPEAAVVVYLGMLRESYGIDLLLSAARAVAARMPHAHFLLMGYPNVEHYRARAEALGLNGRVTFTGAVNYFESPAYLALGDVAVAPKPPTQGGANSKVLNYMAMGLPVVAFDDPLNRKMLGDLGVFAVPGSAASLAEGLLHLLAQPDRGREIGRALRDLVVKEFAWADGARELHGAYAAAGVRVDR